MPITHDVSSGTHRTDQPLESTVDLSEFEYFYTATVRRTTAAVYLVVGSFAEAEDIAQEAYTRAARQWEALRGYDDPSAWVRRVAHNLALDSLRRARTRSLTLWRISDPEPTGLSEDVIDLYRALQRLPVRYRAVLSLHYLWQFSIAEISDELGVPVETVRSRLARGRKRLRALLGATDLSEPTDRGVDR